MHRVVPFLIAAAVLSTDIATAQSLRGSSTSVEKQNRVAKEHDYTFLTNAEHVRRFVDLGLLVALEGNGHYELAALQQPFARPAVQLFVERLSVQYFAACGEKLVVTSLTRPLSGQPRNASDQSVHPAGMAVDLRISNKSSCRRWLESTLLSLENAGVLEATRERRPPHYHIAIFPTTYLAWVDQLERRRAGVVAAAESRSASQRVADATAAESPQAESTVEAETALTTASYRVNRGDTLWSIARKYATSVDELKQLNGLRSSRIAAGQKLVVPVSMQ